MKVDCLRYDGGTYEALLKVASYKNGWNHKIREYVWKKTYGEPIKYEDIDVYVLDGGLNQFKYLYTRKGVIDNYGVR